MMPIGLEVIARADAIVESENADIVHLGGSGIAQSERSDIALNATRADRPAGFRNI